MLSTGRSCDGRRLRMPCVHCSCQTKTISAFFFEFHSPHHKDWRLGSQQVRQNCIGFHGRCKTQRGHLRRKPKICTANPGSSLHLTTTSRNSSCSLSLSLMYTAQSYCMRCAPYNWFIHMCIGVAAQGKQPETELYVL